MVRKIFGTIVILLDSALLAHEFFYYHCLGICSVTGDVAQSSSGALNLTTILFGASVVLGIIANIAIILSIWQSRKISRIWEFSFIVSNTFLLLFLASEFLTHILRYSEG